MIWAGPTAEYQIPVLVACSSLSDHAECQLLELIAEEGKSTDLVYHEPVTAERIGTIALSLIPSRTRQTQSSMKLVQAPVQVRTS